MSKRENLIRKTNAAIEAYKSQRVRWVTGVSQTKTDIDDKSYRQLVDAIMKEEIERHMITGAIKDKGPLTIGEISQLTSIQPGKIVQHIIALRKNGILTEVGEKDRQYLYQLV